MGLEGYAAGTPRVCRTIGLPDPWNPSADWNAALPQFFADKGNKLAAVFIEIVQGSGGIRVVPQAYLDLLFACSRQYGALLVVDEVATGIHRTGPFLASEGRALQGDILLLGKAITGGMFPLSMVGMNENVFRQCVSDERTHRMPGFTDSGHPVGCAIALGVLDLVDSEEFQETAARGRTIIAEGLKEISSATVEDVRGEGHMYGIVCRAKFDRLESSGRDAIGEVISEGLRAGLLIHPLQGGVIPVMPALTATKNELEEIIRRLRAVVSSPQSGGRVS
jgi:adenosylmethionine-8-amino-7-oxononanoate aminotransferase